MSEEQSQKENENQNAATEEVEQESNQFQKVIIDSSDLNRPRFFSHFKAILFRRFVLFKRSWKTTVFSMAATLFFTALAILAQTIIASLVNENSSPLTFASFGSSTDYLIIVGTESAKTAHQQDIESISQLYRQDMGRDPVFLEYETREAMNEALYRNISTKTGVQSIAMGFIFGDAADDITLLYNGTLGMTSSNTTQPLYAETTLARAKLAQNGKSFTVKFVTLTQKTVEQTFAAVGPMMISGGLLSTIPMLISQPIIDTNGEVRQYMISCTLTLFPYWLATFCIDMIIWLVTTFIIWLLFLICQVTAFVDNLFTIWYILALCGPAFILFIYCCSFFFESPNAASRNMFIILCIILVIPVVTDIIQSYEPNPLWYDWFMAFFPFTNFQRQTMYVAQRMGFLTEPFSFYWKNGNSQPYFIMQYVNIIIYAVILAIIEKVRLIIRTKDAKRTFGNYHSFFEETKKKHPVSPEAREMEELVESSNDFAVRIHNCSRLFFNTAGEPVAAVNGVSLGVKKNSIFGFLGANGAGKTTLIKMITSMLPPSDGTIEINGVDIEKYNDPTVLSICPQFNSHLCAEMTPREHFYMYSLIHLLDQETTKEATQRLFSSLEMEHLADIPIRELSGGDTRKLAIALSFFGPAQIILLDEPTASLDPVARHKVHDMILSYKGQKTFMLCTHLLSEAEFLCDMISIMVKGCVYTCGTSQYLTQKFGTDFKIDVMLTDDKPETEEKCDKFFQEKLPAAVMTIRRPKARIYSIPAANQPLSQLFLSMQEGEDSDNGISYFTCSSSSLERVFMEIVHMSEHDDITLVGQSP